MFMRIDQVYEAASGSGYSEYGITCNRESKSYELISKQALAKK
jgi:hypothetical protein